MIDFKKQAVTLGRMAAREMQRRADAWVNTLTGVGTSRDADEWTAFMLRQHLDDNTAAAIYSENDIAARVCDTYPEYAIKKGFNINIRVGADYDADAIEAKKRDEKLMRDELARLKAVSKLTSAAVWGNVFGKGVALIGIDDGSESLDQPVNEGGIRSILHLTVYDKRRVTVKEYYEDSNEPKYGDPKVYTLSAKARQGEAIDVHESRVLTFEGVRTPDDEKSNRGGFDYSFLNRAHKIVRQTAMSWDTLSALIAEASQGVFYIDGYIEALAGDEEEVIEKRMTLIDMMRNRLRSLVLDAQSERFERVPVNFGGISEAFDQLMYRLSLATTIPVTILMGRSPAGMNATGESDLEMFYSRVENFRDLFVTPEAEKLIRYIFKASDGPFTGEPDNWQIKYKDPRSVSPDKKIQEDKTKAETDAIYLDRGVITEEECGVSRFGPDSDSDITIDIEARALKAEEKPYGTEQEPDVTSGEDALQNEGASDNPGGQQGATASNTDQNRRQ